jgi:hypothetical protein
MMKAGAAYHVALSYREVVEGEDEGRQHDYAPPKE